MIAVDLVVLLILFGGGGFILSYKLGASKKIKDAAKEKEAWKEGYLAAKKEAEGKLPKLDAHNIDELFKE